MRAKATFLMLGLVLLTGLKGQAQKVSDARLEKVLESMDRAAAVFKNASADFTWTQYTLVVDETDVQTGKIYFRRSGDEIHMMADIKQPVQKYVLFSGDKLQLYQPTIERVTEYKAGKSREELESWMVLGFGGGGHSLLKSFQVSYAGTEKVAGVEAGKLELVPKSERARAVFAKVTLWIDAERGVAVRQKFLEDSGDYRVTEYQGIELNQSLPDDVFKLKTTGKTTFVRPGG